jgi:hypothetical protein
VSVSAGCRFDDKNLHTGIFFKAIAKHSPHAQQQYLRRANRAFDLMTKKEKAPYNVAGMLCAMTRFLSARLLFELRLSSIEFHGVWLLA